MALYKVQPPPGLPIASENCLRNKLIISISMLSRSVPICDRKEIANVD